MVQHLTIFNIHGGIGDIIYSYNPIKYIINPNDVNIIVTNNSKSINNTFIKMLFHDDIFQNMYFINMKLDKQKYSKLIDKYSNIPLKKINYRPISRTEYINYFTIPNFHDKIIFPINEERSQKLYNDLISKTGQNYILIHERFIDNNNRDMKPINRDYFMNKDLPVYNFDFDSDENYGIKSDLIFDYYNIIINAKEIHIYNGALLCFLDRINHKLQNVYLHAYCKDVNNNIDYMNWFKEWNKKGITFASKFIVID